MLSININLVHTVHVDASEAVELMQALAVVERYAKHRATDPNSPEGMRQRRRHRRRLRLHVTADC